MPNGDGDYSVVVRDLERRFGEFRAVAGVSFDVRKGEIFGFLGPNGAGKSTAIRMLCGILAPTSGEARVAGYDIRKEPEAVKAHIGYMSQKFSLYEDLTVEENIDFYSGIYRIPDEKKAARKEWAVEMAGLREHRGSLTRVLSGGWKQRLALGCAILHEPPVLFLDEPTSGVDPMSRRKFWDLIYDLSSRGTTVFVSTHYMDEAEYCDRIGLMYRGELIALDTPEALKRDAMSDAVLEVVCDRPQDALEVLQGAHGVKEAALFGQALHVVVADADSSRGPVREALEAAGHAVEAVEPVTPSLEDVFVSLIEARDKAEAPRKAVAA
jgi:ABC-2 type transport system ATP-binding protein